MRAHWSAAGLALLFTTGAHAAAIGTGLFNTFPHIAGHVRAGEADEVSRDFAEGLKKPLRIDIHPQSDPVEVAKIGLWLYEHRPAAYLDGSCVGACAKSILLSGAIQHIKPGTLIALGGITEFPLTVQRQVDAGELFNDNDARSQAARERFSQTIQPEVERARALQRVSSQQGTLPAAPRDFVNALTGGWRVRNTGFEAGQSAHMTLATPKHACLWWVPDAQGLRELGLDVPNYAPVSQAHAAKLLEVPAYLVYVGPMVAPLPEEPLCKEGASIEFNSLP